MASDPDPALYRVREGCVLALALAFLGAAAVVLWVML
jgi:hypothetical protein